MEQLVDMFTRMVGPFEYNCDPGLGTLSSARGIKEETKEIQVRKSDEYIEQSVTDDGHVISLSDQHNVPHLSTTENKKVASNSCHEHFCDWPVIRKEEPEDGESDNRVHVLSSASGPLAGLKGALQAHSEQMAQAKNRAEEQIIGVDAFKAVDQEERRNMATCGTLIPKGRLATGFMPTNGVIHTVNQVAKELCSIKDELGRKRISSLLHTSPRDAASLRSTPSGEVHNKLEKNRRAHLKECFELLRRQLPSMEDKKISNQTILKAAFRYIQTLKRKERELEHEMERLARAKIALQQNVSSLKKELQSKYDHMDFSAINPDSTALEQMKDKDTKSTTTASEQPDYDERYAISDVEMSIPNSPYQDVTNFAERTKLCADESDYDQPLNLSTAQSYSDGHKTDWDRMESDFTGSQLLSASSSSSISKAPIVSACNFTTDTPSCFVKEISAGDCRLSKECIVPTAHITQISLPPVVSPLPQVGGSILPVTGSVNSICGLSAVGGSQVAQLSQIVKSGTCISQLPSIAKVVTAWSPNNAVLTQSSSATVINQSHPNYSPNVPQLTISGGVGDISNINRTTLTRVSTAPGSLTTTTVASSNTHALPLVGGGGLHIPAQLVANNVQFGTPTGGIISPQAIQVITPEGYKLVSTDGTINGAKPLTIIAQSDGLETLSEDGKTGPIMVSVNKNGLSSFHLAVPATVNRSIAASSQGSSVPMTSVPMNLTVGGATSLKMTQAGSTSLLPSYIPVANTNGIARLLPGMSVVAPLVVSSSQRSFMIPTMSTAINKIKTHGSSHLSTPSLPLVPAQYASALTGGLVNSVVVVSASSSAVTSSYTAVTKQ